MNRRLLYFIIIGLIILLGLGAALIYFTNIVNRQETQTDVGTGKMKITKVLDDRVIAPIPDSSNATVWYFNSAGHLFTANTNGTNLSEIPRPATPPGNLIQVLWPKIGEDYILLTKNDSVMTKNYYDSKNKVYLNMAPNIQWLDWLPDGKRVIYIWQSTDKKSQQLVMANGDGSGYKKIADVFYPDLAVKADPNGKMALMYRTSIQGDTNKIYAIDLTSGQVVALVESGKSTAAKWLPSGNAFLYSQTDSSGLKTFLYDLASHKSADLNLNTSLDDVVVDATSKTVYAAVPNSNNSGDKFVKFDLISALKSDYFVPETSTKPSSLILIGNTIYFINSADGKLYMISS